MRGMIMAATFLAAAPAGAQGFARGEEMTLRIALEECLGFIRHGRTPFQGWPGRPLARKNFTERFGFFQTTGPKMEGVELASPQAVGKTLGAALWGLEKDRRSCSFAGSGPGPGGVEFPVRAEGFLPELDARARLEDFGSLNSGKSPERLAEPVDERHWSRMETLADGSRAPIPWTKGQPLSEGILFISFSMGDERNQIAHIVVFGPKKSPGS